MRRKVRIFQNGKKTKIHNSRGTIQPTETKIIHPHIIVNCSTDATMTLKAVTERQFPVKGKTSADFFQQ